VKRVAIWSAVGAVIAGGWNIIFVDPRDQLQPAPHQEAINGAVAGAVLGLMSLLFRRT